MDRINFLIFAIIAALFWIAGISFVYSRKKALRTPGIILVFSGVIAIALFIFIIWLKLERPPLRTLGETRLWYVFLLSLAGTVFFLRWKYKWFLTYSILMALVFMLINIIHPEAFDRTLLPALQSPWFIPHVVVYILGYALLGASAIVAIYGLFRHYVHNFDNKIILLADNLVYQGFAFLTLGLLFGAIWAKQAWGHYWTWDPKETWAFLTWLCYLIYIHLRYYHPARIRGGLWILSLAFIILVIAWFGINYLPAAKGSIHTYS